MPSNRFKDRVSDNPNRRKLTIISQSPNMIIADVERADTVMGEVGTPISAAVMNEWEDRIITTEQNANSAVLKGGEAVKTAENAKFISDNALGFVNALTQAPDYSQANNIGAPYVGFADTENGHKKFVFKNLKGERGERGPIGAGWSLDFAYPIGAIFISTKSTSPASLYGGTWELIQGRTLVGVGTGIDANGTEKTFTAGQTGGAYTHTLSVDEMPEHNHNPIYLSNGKFADYSFGIFDKNNYTARKKVFGLDRNIMYADNYTDEALFIDTNNGGNQSFESLPSYMAVYIWKRTA